MQKTTKKFLIGFGLCLAIFIVSSITLVFLHESAHQQIFKAFGVQSEIQLSWPIATTTPTTGYENLSIEDMRVLNALQAANEVYGYQILTIIGAITLFTGIIYTINTINKEKKQRSGKACRCAAWLASPRKP